MASTDPATRGRGGGIDIISSTGQVLISANTLQANVAYSGTLTSPNVVQFGIGGGIWIDEASSAVISGNQIISNTASQTDIPADAYGGGGGIGAFGNNTFLTINNNRIEANIGNAVNGDGEGGGIALYSVNATGISSNSIVGNTSAFSATDARGGGIRASAVQTLTLTENWVADNVAAIASSQNGSGGGIHLSTSSSGSAQYLLVSENWIVSNTATITSSGLTANANGGGIQIEGYSTGNEFLSVQDNHIIANIAAQTMLVSGPNAQGHAEGGGLQIGSISTTLVSGNEIRGNYAVETLSMSGSSGWGGRPSGGGLHLSDNDVVTITENSILDNITALRQTVSDVGSNSEGGGVALINVGIVSVTDNVISGNMAVITASVSGSSGDNYGALGGGLRLGCWNRPDCSISFSGNDLVHNTAAFTISVTGSNAEAWSGGGGLFADSIPALSLVGNQAVSNRAVISIHSDVPNSNISAEGGGIYINGNNYANDSITIQNNTLLSNVAGHAMTISGTDVRAHATGGGLLIGQFSTTHIISNTAQGNIAVGTFSVSGSGGWGGRPAGGGMYLSQIDTVTLRDNVVDDNVTAEEQLLTNVGSNSEGGGIAMRDIISATLRDNIISSNTAVISANVTGSAGDFYDPSGGGLSIDCDNNGPDCAVTLSDNTISHNTTAFRVTVEGGNTGAGISGGGLAGHASFITLESNQVMSNTAVASLSSVVPSQNASANGGGININGFDIPDDSLRLENNKIIGNMAAGTVTISGTNSTSDVAGGGLNINNITTTFIISNEVRENTAAESLSITGSGGWGGQPNGGGLNLSNSDIVMAYYNQFIDNVTVKQHTVNEVSSSSDGGGFSINDVESATINNNTITGNIDVVTASFSSNSGETYFPNGGGVRISCFNMPNCAISFEANLVSNNVSADTITISGTNANASAFGGGIRAMGVGVLTLTNNTIVQNVASKTAPNGQGGGLNLLTVGTGLLQGNVISGNVGHLSGSFGVGGAMEVAESNIKMTQNRILGNQTAPSGSGTPAVWVWQGNLASSNDIVAHNYGGIGLGTSGVPATLTIINDTFYNNGDRAIEANDTASSVYVTNTIVFSHTDGFRLNNPASTLIGDYNLLSNTTNFAGAAAGGANDLLNQDPLFVNAANDNFRLSSSSPAIDAGDNGPCPSDDHDGNIRPVDGDASGSATCDMGAFEAIPLLTIGKGGAGQRRLWRADYLLAVHNEFRQRRGHRASHHRFDTNQCHLRQWGSIGWKCSQLDDRQPERR